MGFLHEALPASTLVVAIDPGKVSKRVWLSTGEAGAVVPPLSLLVLGPGLDQLHRLVIDHAGAAGPVFGIEATGGLHQAWVRELSQRFPRSVQVFAPSETAAARAQRGSRRFKTDDRDCAALTYLARQGQGRPSPTRSRTRSPPRCARPGRRAQGRPAAPARPAPCALSRPGGPRGPRPSAAG